MCDEAAFCPITDVPDFITITGFVGVIRLTVSMKRRPFLISSTYRMIAFVAGSVPVHLMKSSNVRSSWLPTEITAENPISSGRLQSTIVVMIAPLWEINAMEPGRGGPDQTWC